MKILGNRVLVSPLEKEEKEGFTAVEVQDSFVYKGKVEQGEFMCTGGSVKPGDTILFAKYSPDTQEIEHEGKKYKVVQVADILAIL